MISIRKPKSKINKIVGKDLSNVYFTNNNVLGVIISTKNIIFRNKQHMNKLYFLIIELFIKQYQILAQNKKSKCFNPSTYKLVK